MYNSKYYTCEQIDQRLLEGYYDDAVAVGYTGSKAQYLAGLLKAINYSANPTLTADKVVYNPAIGGLTSKNVKAALDELSNKWYELSKAVWPLEVILNISPILIEFTGHDQVINVTYLVKRKDVEVIPTALDLFVNGARITVDLKPSDTITVNVNREGESTFVLTAKLDDLVKSATAKMVMVLPVYFGFGTSEADVAIAANKLEPRTSAAGVYEKTSPTDDVNFIILVPKTLEGLSSFTMGGAPFVMNTSSVVINGKDYYMYKSGGVYMSGTTVRVLAG